MRPRLLDLFACEGGAAVGYHRAGWDVVGVDLDANRLKRYPFENYVADALAFVRDFGDQFDAIHASPPCQGYSRGNMTWNGLFECIPPAFTEHIGTQLLAHIGVEVAA